MALIAYKTLVRYVWARTFLCNKVYFMTKAKAATLQIGRGAKAVVLVVIAITVILASRQLWLPLIGGFLVVADPLQPADALLPLAGGQERVVYAAKLFNQG